MSWLLNVNDGYANMLAVLYRNAERLYASVTVKAIGPSVVFGPDQPISPKSLPAEERPRGWRTPGSLGSVGYLQLVNPLHRDSVQLSLWRQSGRERRDLDERLPA